MAFTLATLRQELYDRGFDYLSTTRARYFLNRSYLRACERYPWPFLETSTTGTAPLTISDIRAVLSVTDQTIGSPLSFRDSRTVREEDPTLAATGNPDFWYLSGGTTITVYPPNTTNTLLVGYIQVPDELTADADVPLIPSRFQYLIVDGACWYAYRDSDNSEMADSAFQSYDDAIEEMAESLMVPNMDSMTDIVIRGSVDW